MKKTISKNTKEMKLGQGRAVILRPYVSEKAQRLLAHDQYVFLVEPEANKVLVKQEIERTYGVHVISMTMTVIRAKSQRYRGKVSHFRNKKKATVRLKNGETIDMA